MSDETEKTNTEAETAAADESQEQAAPVEAEAPAAPEADASEAAPSEQEAAEASESEADEESVVGGDPRPELRQLMELAVKYPEIGPPLAELAFKTGNADIGERIVKMGLDDDGTTGVEFYAVAVDVARREGRYEDVFGQVEDALQSFAGTDGSSISDDEANRLLHLVRSAFAVLLFDLEDVNAKPEWVKRLAAELPALGARYESDPFYHSLLAQALWFTDKDASEKMWEKAIELADGEFAWNARGTWYKDAAKDFNAAQAAYRNGLKVLPESALLLHNLAQLLTDEAASKKDEDVEQARNWLREAEGLVRSALRKDARRGLRRYIHGTKDRVRKLLNKLPAEEVEPPTLGESLKGRVVAVVQYGCFVTVRGGIKGLLHKSELAWERVNDPNEIVKVGDQIQVKVISVEDQDDGTVRVGFSRKQLLKAPEGADKQDNNRGGGNRNDRNKGGKGGGRGRGNNNNNRKGGGGGGGGGGGRGRGGKKGGSRGHREEPKRNDGMGSLGELLLAKLEEAKSDD